MGIDRPVVQLADVEVPRENEDAIQHDFTLDQSLHFLPRAKLLIVIPPGNDQLLRRQQRAAWPRPGLAPRAGSPCAQGHSLSRNGDRQLEDAEPGRFFVGTGFE
jgi:hypothetical protein